MNIKGIRTDYVTNESENVELEYEINEQDDHRLIFNLIGGPTGYEDFYIDGDLSNLKSMSERGWRACVGTKGVYDTLRIPAEEMKKVYEYLKNEGE